MKKLILTLGLACLFITANYAQETDKEKKNKENEKTILIEIKEGAEPVIYIDGKKYDKDIIDIIDKSKIEKIKIIKADSAFYNLNTPSVIIITTKKGKDKEVININYDFDYNYEYEIDVEKIRKSVKPVVIINGTIVDNDSLQKISKDDIMMIEVLKDRETLTKYNTKKGVIIVTTKKKKKDKKKK